MWNISFIFLSVLFLSYCKPKNIDPQTPCEELADFKIYEKVEFLKTNSLPSEVFYYKESIENDTFCMAQGVSGHRVFFEAKYEGASKYEWWIGDDPEPYIGRVISILFWDKYIQGNPAVIPIKLVVTRKDREDCNQNGQYTKTKNITLLRPNKAPWIGKYLSYDDNNQPQIIEVVSFSDGTGYTFNLKYVIGQGECNALVENSIGYGTAFLFYFHRDGWGTPTSQQNCFARYGHGYLDPKNRNKLILEYSLEKFYLGSTEPRNFPYTPKTITAYRLPN
jgi:hypothetical protein